MNKPEPIAPSLFVTRDVLRQIARESIADMEGQFAQEDIFRKVKEAALASNLHSLLDESAWAITKAEIRRQARPRLMDNDDWIGYGEMLIKLPEGRVVKVIHATIADLDIRENNVKDNLAAITASAEAEFARIRDLKATMIAHNMAYAGEAIDYLAKHR